MTVRCSALRSAPRGRHYAERVPLQPSPQAGRPLRVRDRPWAFAALLAVQALAVAAVLVVGCRTTR